VLSVVDVQYEQLNDLRVKFEGSLQCQDDLHAKYDLNLTVDNLKVAALQAEEEAETVAEQFLTGSICLKRFSLIIVVLTTGVLSDAFCNRCKGGIT